MKQIGMSLVALLGALSTTAMAQCSGTGTEQLLTLGQLRTLVGNHLVCGRPASDYPGAASDRWQEEHLGPSSGELWDYKLGTDPRDKRKKVGSWSTTGNAFGVITHTYDYFPPPVAFSWRVYGPWPVDRTAVYHFCTVSNPAVPHVKAYVIANGGTGCGGVFPPP